jgi:alkylation response protein AidB-like acyl-CoA dehydrogenase
VPPHFPAGFFEEAEETVLTTDVPTREQLVRRAAELLPVLQKNAAWAEQNRRIHEESIEALADAGFFKLRAPTRYGGFESDAHTLVDVSSEIARGDASTAWVVQVLTITTWMAGLFPDEVQDEVFATPNARVCGTLSPTATVVPADGGYTLNGKWGFISGALHSHWQVVVAISPTEEGGPQPIMALAPMSDLQLVDDWHTSGLRGTGSITTVAENVFLPRERVLPLGAILHEQYASKQNSTSPVYRLPMLPNASVSSCGAVLGMAKGAWDAFFERLPGRGVSYTSYTDQRTAPLTHLQVAEVAMKIDEADFHAHHLARTVDAKADHGSEWTVEDRVRARADMARVCLLAKEAVDVLATASGGSSIYSHVPIQRINRDVQAVNLHALMHPNTNAELYGRVLCGLGPNTLYI